MYLAIRNSLLVPVLLLLLAGCGGGHSAGNVAVVDLDKVAAATGNDKRINVRVHDYVTTQEAVLSKLRDATRAQIDNQKKQLPANASEDARRKLAELSQKLEREMRQKHARTQQGVAQLRRSLNVGFRGEVETVAKRIAALRGMDIVMAKQSAMLYVDPKADITDAVVVEMLRSDKQQAPAAEPAANPAK